MASHKKIASNIYYDKRCTKFPYYVSIMRRGHSMYRKFDTLEEAENAKQAFILRHSTISTDHELVFERNGIYVLDVTIEKTFIDYEEACRKADIIKRFIDS